ncbi:tRNA uridine-5-carboxymethylaminomethyl(34) synthesis GTPase MnmE [Polynucleobacter sp. MWH-Spelu-300-X4]|uniref:tRNA uridine-5-carboxymethylaminomethyl(34) synthesis GTPase MnmE n=1 Tax=Polynucleobacter sp. MWH-Spelu-300-X4 TaxID=2689109 RepID=UPI001BFDE42C|nr:tRNA uridine-5-carboxymethylaminomethyl(34) synthesis GTPase MnmE [Polynucleobacter sp. MWH-Spelu-300-X4]QWD79755.1 tRNA uridine-5-carboxymethylaminomethyl(34) synthesis GTPase MnmE [Polynucleobacter sp. MWH-Spelu-300-X4]
MENWRAPIIALATAKGRASVGIVRISGSGINQLINALCHRELVPRQATLLSFSDAQNNVIDEGLAIYFPGPHSYTGEDVLELQCHGSSAALAVLIDRCLELGASMDLRLAKPGEFTERAFLNGKMDLAQAEAVADLIDASSALAAKSAAKSLKGEFSKKIHIFLDALTELRALTEATLDFPEEEIDFIKQHDVLGRLEKILNEIHEIKKAAQQGVIIRDGITVVLVGQPNVGKSSLMNALAGEDVAIVTPVAGTTRDRLKETIQLDGVPLHIIDTAGLRETTDSVEQIGIERTWKTIAQADLVLHLLDASQQQNVSDVDQELLTRIKKELAPSVPVQIIWNKIDQSKTKPTVLKNELLVSAKTGEGLDSLKAELLKVAGWQPEAEGGILARKRHLEALSEAEDFIEKSLEQLKNGSSFIELAAEDMRLAQDALSKITGEFLPDDLLGKIFSTFCIGK